ncbi:MAG: phage tail tube protein [Gemmatimonadota bacterium]
MARIIVNGSVPSIAATFRATATITAITNGANAVATLGAGHGTVVGDFVEIVSSGWSRLVGRVFRVSAVSTNDVTLEGCDTTSTATFPAGQGAGTLRAVLSWTDLQQINELNITGGEQQFQEGQYIDNPLQFRFPTNQTPIDVSFNVDDDQAMTFWTQVRAAAASLANRPIRIRDATGIPRAVGTGVWSFSAAPALAVNQVLKRTINVAMAAQFSEYTS